MPSSPRSSARRAILGRPTFQKSGYATEDKVRVAVLIDGRASASKMAAVIARECQPLIAIDILFLESLSDEHRDKIKQMKPFYVAD
jgi:hypothetical protein